MLEPSDEAKEITEESPENNDEEEKAELNKYISELSDRIKQKLQLRNENLVNLKRPNESFFFKLDSSLKKNTAFVKKLKQFTAAQLESLIKDMSTLNLTKYISEVSAAIIEAKLKMSDIQAVVQLCSKLHQIYTEFSSSFFENWQKTLTVKPGEKIQNISKMRVDLRFYCELISAGIFSNKIGLPLLGSCLTNLIKDKEDHSNLSIILSFCKHCGEEYAGLTPRRILLLSKKFDIALPTSTLLPADKQANVKNLLRDYHQTVCKHLKYEHKELQAAERSKRKMMETKGEISNEKREQIETLQSNYEKLVVSTQTLSDLLNENMPELPKDVEPPTEGMVIDMTDEFTDAQLDPWGDEETKSFYVDLPDLRQFLPNFCVTIKDTPPPEDVPQLTEEALDNEADEPELNLEEQAIAEQIEEDSKLAEEEEEATQEQQKSAPLPEKHHHNLMGKAYFDNFLTNLTNCVNKELIDSAAIDFLLNLNSKNNRKKLIKTLFNVHRTRLDLLPLFARFCAIINLVAHDVAHELAQMLKVDFKYHVKKRDQINIESKIKVIRYIGEMVKFGLYSKIEGLLCLKYLLHNFQHHHIEMTCAFLEVCGVYLYNNRDTRLRTNVYLEQMMRLKTATALDSRHSAQVENSYYLVKPIASKGVQQKIRPPMHMYIRHLIFEELNKHNVEKIVKYLRRLNWDDPGTANYAIKCLSKAYNVRYHLIRCLADVVSALSSYQEKAVTKVIDAVFEDIRAGLEQHSPKLAQRRISMAKYLGELYIYKLVDSSNVFNTLYSIISFGITFSHEVSSPVDPPDSLFRLKLALVLLDTCGSYFQSSVSKKKLDCFIVFLQHYYWYKKSHPVFSEQNGDLFPILIEHMYKEVLNTIRPKIKLYKSFDKAKEEVENLRKQLYPNLNEDGELLASERKLNTIDENESEGILTEEYTSENVMDSDDEMLIKPRSEIDENYATDDYDLREPSPGEGEEVKAANVESEKTQEDLEFEAMFEKMSLDSIQERIKESTKINPKDIPVPMTKASKKTYEQLQDDNKNIDSVPFVLMVRSAKGGKQQFRSFAAPSDSQLAVNLKLQEQKIKEENERVKRLTLNITERIEEEDYQESLLPRSPASNRTRPQKVQKFKHQKGAPDPDKIFN